jgi:hypothetical protein
MPDEIRSDRLVALAERWGIADDYEREARIMSASEAERTELAHALDDVDPRLWEWLAGPESHATKPSEEYVRITALTMAVDSARAHLRAGHKG